MANAHEDVSEIRKHTPKNFDDSAILGDVAWKNESQVHEYFPVGKLPDCINVVSAMAAPPTTVENDIYVLTDTTEVLGRQQISALNWQSGSTMRATFDAGHDLTTPAIGDYIHIQNSGESLQNGRFVITAEGAGTVDFTNTSISSSAQDEGSSPAYASFGHEGWDGGTSGDWTRYDGTSWLPVLMGNGSSVYNISNNITYYYRQSLLVTDIKYKYYTADITQTSTSAPTTNIFSVNEIGAIVWAYSAVGVYTGTLTGAFTTAKTWLLAGNLKGGDFEIIRTDANVITLKTFDTSGSAKDAILFKTAIEIRVEY